MFGDLNRVELLGNLTQDPEVRYTTNGTAVVSIGLATNRSFQQNNEWKEETEFTNLVFWAKKAEQIAERAKKGTRLYAEGRLQTRSWDGEDGKKNYKTEVVVNNFIFVDRYEKGESKPGGAPSAQAAQAPKSAPVKDLPADVEVISDDDLPF